MNISEASYTEQFVEGLLLLLRLLLFGLLLLHHWRRSGRTHLAGWVVQRVGRRVGGRAGRAEEVAEGVGVVGHWWLCRRGDYRDGHCRFWIRLYLHFGLDFCSSEEVGEVRLADGRRIRPWGGVCGRCLDGRRRRLFLYWNGNGGRRLVDWNFHWFVSWLWLGLGRIRLRIRFLFRLLSRSSFFVKLYLGSQGIVLSQSLVLLLSQLIR